MAGATSVGGAKEELDSQESPGSSNGPGPRTGGYVNSEQYEPLGKQIKRLATQVEDLQWQLPAAAARAGVRLPAQSLGPRAAQPYG